MKNVVRGFALFVLFAIAAFLCFPLVAFSQRPVPFLPPPLTDVVQTFSIWFSLVLGFLSVFVTEAAKLIPWFKRLNDWTITATAAILTLLAIGYSFGVVPNAFSVFTILGLAQALYAIFKAFKKASQGLPVFSKEGKPPVVVYTPPTPEQTTAATAKKNKRMGSVDVVDFDSEVP